LSREVAGTEPAWIDGVRSSVSLLLLAAALIAAPACQGTISGVAGGADDGGDDAPGGDDPPADAARLDRPDSAPLDDDPVDAGPAGLTCASPDLLFCDDFESYPLGAATSDRWTTETSAGALAIDDSQARGTRALHVHTDGNGHAAIRVPFSPPGNSAFARMHVFVTAFPTAPTFAHFTLVEAAGTSAGLIRPIGGQFVPPPSSGADVGRSLWGVGSDGGPTGDWTDWQPAAPTEAGRWLCLEWELRAAGNAIDVYLDGTLVPELSVSQDDHGGNPVDFVFPTFTSMWFGWQLYQGGPTPSQYDLWIDDIAIGTSRLGC
jgi:hypothetical protein